MKQNSVAGTKKGRASGISGQWHLRGKGQLDRTSRAAEGKSCLEKSEQAWAIEKELNQSVPQKERGGSRARTLRTSRNIYVRRCGSQKEKRSKNLLRSESSN